MNVRTKFEVRSFRKTVSASLPKVDFSKVSTATIESFQSYVVHYLSGINLSDLDVFCCQKADCDNSEHKAQIDTLYFHLTNCLANATQHCFGHSHSKPTTKKVIPGWNDYVMDAKVSASDAHKLWCLWGKPKNGYIFQLMQRTRAQYKYAIRHCRKHEARMQADSLANSLASKHYGSFCRKISRSVAPDSTYSSKVGSAIGPKG